MDLQSKPPNPESWADDDDEIVHLYPISLPPPAYPIPHPEEDIVDGTEGDEKATSWLAGEKYSLIEDGWFYYTTHIDDAHTEDQINQYPADFFFSSYLPDTYRGFCADWGPCSIATVLTFCKEIHEKWEHPQLQNRALIYYSSPACQHVFTNTALMLAAYLMVHHSYSPDDALRPFARISPTPFLPYRDATHVEPQNFQLHAISCLRGLHRAMRLGWLGAQPVHDFDIETYERLDEPSCLNMNQVSPRFIMFLGPQDKHLVRDWDPYMHEPGEYVDEFRKRSVGLIIRLNNADTYDETTFTKAGFDFLDMEFQDCTTPAPSIIKRFLDAVDGAKGVVAVHCLAGLGRTGTLVGIHMMKHHGFTAKEVIGYLRLMRPGSIIGPQQQFLCEMQDAKWDGNYPLLGDEKRAIDLDASAAMASQVAAAVRGGRRGSLNSRCFARAESVGGTGELAARVANASAENSSNFGRIASIVAAAKSAQATADAQELMKKIGQAHANRRDSEIGEESEYAHSFSHSFSFEKSGSFRFERVATLSSSLSSSAEKDGTNSPTGSLGKVSPGAVRSGQRRSSIPKGDNVTRLPSTTYETSEHERDPDSAEFPSNLISPNDG